MHDAGGVEEAHRTQQVVHDDFDMVFGQGVDPIHEHAPQVLSDALEDDHDPSNWLVVLSFRHNEVEDFGRVNVLLRVAELAQNLHLHEDGLEASHIPLSVLLVVRAEFDEFDGDLLTGALAVALEDLAESARANLLTDCVVPLLQVVKRGLLLVRRAGADLAFFHFSTSLLKGDSACFLHI